MSFGRVDVPLHEILHDSIPMNLKKTYWCMPLLLFSLVHLTACNEYERIAGTASLDYKYEAAKQWYAEGYYNNASIVLNDAIIMLKGTDKGEESLFLLGLSSYKARNYEMAAQTFKRYYASYPKGIYTEKAHYLAGMALYESAPEIKLDQTAVYEAVTEFQNYLEIYPAGVKSEEAQRMVFMLQDRLVEKEYLSAKLYFDLGPYFGNCDNGGSNYQACIITAENAIRDYPYTSRREDLSILILRAKFELAQQSVDSKKEERYNAAIDEYYGFTGEYPESKYRPEAEAMFAKAKKYLGTDVAAEATK